MGLKNIGTNTTNEEILCRKCSSRISVSGMPEYADSYSGYHPPPMMHPPPVQYMYPTGCPPMFYHCHPQENPRLAPGCPYFPYPCYSHPHLLQHPHLPPQGWVYMPPNISVPAFENIHVKEPEVSVPLMTETGNGYTRIIHTGSGESSWPLQGKNNVVLREKASNDYKNMSQILPKYYVDEKCQTDAIVEDPFPMSENFTGCSQLSPQVARPKQRSFSAYTHLNVIPVGSNSEESIPSDENNGDSDPTTTMAEQPSADSQEQNNQINSSQENSPCHEKHSCHMAEPDQSEQMFSGNLMSFVYNEDLFKPSSDDRKDKDSEEASPAKKSELLEFLQSSTYVYEPESAKSNQQPREYLKGILKNRIDPQNATISHCTTSKTEVEIVSDVSSQHPEVDYRPRYKRRVKHQSFYEPRTADLRETEEINFLAAPLEFPKPSAASSVQQAREAFRLAFSRRNQTNCTRDMY